MSSGSSNGPDCFKDSHKTKSISIMKIWNLEVHQLKEKDVYQDMFRVPDIFRTDLNDQPIAEGILCKIRTGNKQAYGFARGLEDESNQIIRLDGLMRRNLGVERNGAFDFTFRKAKLIEEFRWAWSASNPAYRVAARMAVLSIILSISSLFIAVFPWLNRIWCLGVSLFVAVFIRLHCICHFVAEMCD